MRSKSSKRSRRRATREGIPAAASVDRRRREEEEPDLEEDHREGDHEHEDPLDGGHLVLLALVVHALGAHRAQPRQVLADALRPAGHLVVRRRRPAQQPHEREARDGEHDDHEEDGAHRELAGGDGARADPHREQRRAGPDVQRREQHHRLQSDAFERELHIQECIRIHSSYVNGLTVTPFPRREPGPHAPGAARRRRRGLRRARPAPHERRGDRRARRLHARRLLLELREQGGALRRAAPEHRLRARTARWARRSSRATAPVPTARESAEQLAQIQAHPDGRWMFRLWLELLLEAGRDEKMRELAVEFWRTNRELMAKLAARRFEEQGRAPPLPPDARPARSSRWTSAWRSSTTSTRKRSRSTSTPTSSAPSSTRSSAVARAAPAAIGDGE